MFEIGDLVSLSNLPNSEDECQGQVVKVVRVYPEDEWVCVEVVHPSDGNIFWADVRPSWVEKVFTI